MAKTIGPYDRIQELIATDAIEPTPSNYEFLYRYVSGSDPQLVAAVDALRQSQGRLDQRAIGTIRRELYGIGGAGIWQLFDDAEAQLARISDCVEKSDADARDYRDKLGRNDIDAGATIERQRAMLADIIDATNVMIGQTDQLQEQLSHSSREIERLKADLEIARIESRLDGLTGLANRKACCDYLDKQIARAEAEGRPLALIFLDIDHFKKFNDNFGHRMGDEVLRLVSHSLERFFHATGFVARWGGEEFVIVMADRDVAEAVDYADRFRAEIASRTVRTRQSGKDVGRITLSLGVADRIAGDTAQAIIDRADAALYDAKAEGRDRVVRWQDAA